MDAVVAVAGVPQSRRTGVSALVAGASRDQRREMKLRVALATSTFLIRGRVHELGTVWTRALEIAEELGDRDYQLRSLRGLHTFYSHSDFCKSLEIAKTFCLIAEQQRDKNDRLIGDGLVGMSEHLLGDQTSARAHIERMLANYPVPTPVGSNSMSPVHSLRGFFGYRHFPIRRCAPPKTLFGGL